MFTLSESDHEGICSLWPHIQVTAANAFRSCHRHNLDVHIEKARVPFVASNLTTDLCCLHEYGIAFDIRLDAQNQTRFLNAWQLTGELFESFGFTWGGRSRGVAAAKHIQWDRGIGNRPRSVERMYREGGEVHIHSHLNRPTGSEMSETNFRLFVNRTYIDVGHLVQGNLYIKQENIKWPTLSRERLILDVDTMAQIYTNAYDVDFSQWPEVHLESKVSLELGQL